MNCLPTQSQLLLRASVGQEGAFRWISRFLELTWARRSCSLAGVDGKGLVVLPRRIQRFRLLEFLAQLPPCIVAMVTKAQALDRHVRPDIIERSHPKVSVGAQQCSVLSISRSSFYYEPLGETAMNLALLRLIYQQFLDTPFYGVRQMTWHLQNEEHDVNQKRIRRLMHLMRLMPIYQKPETSRPSKGHKTYPYLCWAVHGSNGPNRSGVPTSPEP